MGGEGRVTELGSRLEPLVRRDIVGRFSELEMLRREWPLYASTVDGSILPPYEVLIHPSSGCNLACAWCIGDHVPIAIRDDEDQIAAVLDAAKTSDERLPNTMADVPNMMKVVADIVDYEAVGSYELAGTTHERTFRVGAVSFSGLIGEPLVARQAVTAAMHFLVDHERRVGIFTNGVLIDAPTAEAILRSAYIHLSLDAGTATTYARLKYQGRVAGENLFHRALSNLRALAEARRAERSALDINTSFIMYPENYVEVLDAARLVKDSGANCLRLKQDNSGERLLDDSQRAQALELVARIRDELVDDTFSLVEVHLLTDTAEMGRSCSSCSITNLMAAIGSDGHLYPCNYHPRPGGATFGSAVDTSFREVWEGTRRRALRKHLPMICPRVCDPFKNRSNRLLHAANTIAMEENLDSLWAELTATP